MTNIQRNIDIMKNFMVLFGENFDLSICNGDNIVITNFSGPKSILILFKNTSDMIEYGSYITSVYDKLPRMHIRRRPPYFVSFFLNTNQIEMMIEKIINDFGGEVDLSIIDGLRSIQ